MSDRRQQVMQLQDKWKFKTIYGLIDTSKSGGGIALDVACQYGGKVVAHKGSMFQLQYSEWIELEKAMDRVNELGVDAQLVPCKATDL